MPTSSERANRAHRDGDHHTGLGELRRGLRDLTLVDERRLRRRLDRLGGIRDERKRADASATLLDEYATARTRVELRRLARPERITYPQQLPVAQRVDELAQVIREHQVVVIAGETGSGKTTQLPKICLGLGRGIRGLIGHTQPRRIAARSVAERLAAELDVDLGGAVGYQMRFADHTGDDTLVKVMTDGILLAEIGADRDLRRYDTIIVDEAHERSLNIDFLLGYLSRLLPRRPDLKMLITSATIDPGKFAHHFGDAPIVEVSGRTYPVEIRYRPRPAGTGDDPDADSVDQIGAVLDAIDELSAQGRGDILVFCSGEREIRDTADAIKARRLTDTEVLPLYARLSSAEQHKVFAAHTARRIVLATNVAETSLTVPGIRYVIDPGTARISRYSRRLKVQRLPIEPISQASADQRAGRCGRLADGICIRLYSEDDYRGRPAFTDPEILRTSLASVILQMEALGLGDMRAFPFVDPPDARTVNDGVRLLEELGALDPTPSRQGRRLTEVGRQLAALPLDPRMARMVVEAEKLGCLSEVLVIAAGLTIADPRERPAEHRQAADDKHRRFRAGAATDSDFIAYLNLWRYLRDQRRELSGSAFRRMCAREYLHYLRIREWQDLHGQLRDTCRQLRLRVPAGQPDPDGKAMLVHQAMLPGLLGHVGLRDPERRAYLGARGASFSISPASVLFKKQPDWVMAAELVETSRLWAHTAAKIDPAWVERAGAHLLRRTYSEPHWEKKAEAVMAYEKVTLYGIPVVARRKVAYGRIDPELARELFIRRALVEGDWDTRHRFFHANRDLLDGVAELEDRARRRDLLVDDETLFAFYDERIPADVVSGRHFDTWWKKASQRTPDLLTLTPEVVIDADAQRVSQSDYPDVWTVGGIDLAVTYQFEPGAAADGVTVHVPIDVLNQLTPEPFSWQIPGLRADLATAMVRALPKRLRRLFVPAPDAAARALEQVHPDGQGFAQALTARLSTMAGVAVSADDIDLARVPAHLLVTFCVEGSRGRILGDGKDLPALQRQLTGQMRSKLADVGRDVERAGLTGWSFDRLPAQLTGPGPGGGSVTGYPALVDEGSSVAVRVLESAAEAERTTWAGQRRLLMLAMPTGTAARRSVLASLDNRQKLALADSPYANAAALFDDAVLATVDALMRAHDAPGADRAGFERLLVQVRQDFVPALTTVLADTAAVLAAARELRDLLAAPGTSVTEPSLADLRTQLNDLVAPGFIAAAGRARLHDTLRYLRGMRQRLDKLAGAPGRDLVKLEQVSALEREYAGLAAQTAELGQPPSVALQHARWLLQELRVSEFAQGLRTAEPVSAKRVRRVLDEAAAALRANRH